MKVAYHFACDNIKVCYDRHFYNILFKKLLKLKPEFISSKILIGDLLLDNFSNNLPGPRALLNLLVGEDSWRRISEASIERFVEENVFVICFETIQKELAEKLHLVLQSDENYLGATEIDNSIQLQWWLYGECIGSKFRIYNRRFYVQIDTNDPEDKEYAEEFVNFFKTLHFDEVNIEYSNYRYSLFDDNHNYENAKRVSEWKKSTESLFSTVTEEIISKLTDIAPELSNKLWAINNAYTNAVTGEQYAQAMLSCRRVFEYVTDCIFPAKDEIINGHSLKKDKYKNRLIEFAKSEFKGDANIDLIVANTVALFDEWTKLYDLSNKGVHGEPHKQECRRCILRTILLLDDIISIKDEPFKVEINMDRLIKKMQH